MSAIHVHVADLPSSVNASRFDGDEHGAMVSFFLSRNAPGTGPGLHVHPYEETFIVQQGTITFTAGDETLEASEGDIVVVPAHVPHKFVNSGSIPIRSVNIHPVAQMETEWLD